MTPLLLAARDAGDIATVIGGVLVLGLLAAFVVRAMFREKAPASVPVAAADEIKCPCGAKATKPLPRARVRDLPLVGRVISRDADGFGDLVVCDAHSDVAASVIDERIAEARLHDARAQRDKLTAIANGKDVLGVVAETLPEEQQRAWKRSKQLGAAPVVRALKAASDEGTGESG